MHVKGPDWPPYIGSDDSRRNTGIKGDAGAIVEDHGLVHDDRLANICCIPDPWQKYLHQPRSEDKIARAYEYPYVRPVAIFDDYFGRRQWRPADAVGVVSPLHEPRTPFFAR